MKSSETGKSPKEVFERAQMRSIRTKQTTNQQLLPEEEEFLRTYRRPAQSSGERRNFVRPEPVQTSDVFRARHSLQSRFVSCLQAYLAGEADQSPKEEVRRLAAQLLEDYQITIGNLQERNVFPGSIEEYKTKMYNQLRLLISQNRVQGESSRLSSFWNMFAQEMKMQLNGIAKVADVAHDSLGNPAAIVAEELSRKTDI